MPKVFISYRRDDSNAITGRIRQTLVTHFGSKNVFRDLNSIPLGANFRDVIEEGLAWCDVVLVIVGDKWVNITDSKENKRLDKPDDFVRIEVETALRLHKKVIPILVNKAVMPTQAELPSTLSRLPDRNAATVRDDPDFDNDMTHLIAAISDERKWLRYLIGILIVLVILAVIGFVASNPNTAKSTVTPTTAVIADVPTDTLRPSDTAVIPSSTFLPTETPQPPSNTPIPPTPTTAPVILPTPTPLGNTVQLELSADSNTLTLYVSQKVSLAGLQFVVVNNDAQEVHPIEQAFSILQLTQYAAEANTCFVYRLSGSGSPLPDKCDVNRVFRHELARSDIFWYDSVANRLRDLAIDNEGGFIKLCPASDPSCTFNWPAEAIVLGNAQPTVMSTGKGYPCVGIIAMTGGGLLGQVKANPAKNASAKPPVQQESSVVILTSHNNDGLTWYQITYSNGEYTGWIPAQYVNQSDNCP